MFTQVYDEHFDKSSFSSPSVAGKLYIQYVVVLRGWFILE